MSLFDACEEFLKQINPQYYDYEENNSFQTDEKKAVIESDDDYSYCPIVDSMYQLVEYVIYAQKYLWEKKQN